MRNLLLITLAGTLLTLPLVAQSRGDYRDPATTADQGWTVLFNGKDLSGFVVVLEGPDGKVKRYPAEALGQQTTFTAENGLLKTTGTPTGYIRTAAVYDNFVFHVEARFLKFGNSGVLLHVQQDDVLPASIECQLYYATMGRTFPLKGSKLDGGELIHYASKPVGEWNTIEVTSEEGRLATAINGTVVALAANADPRVGYICLQSEGAPVEFRNIKIKRFTPAHHLRPKP